jgi:hypothetical protein
LGWHQDDKIKEHGQDTAGEYGQWKGNYRRQIHAEEGKGDKGAHRGYVSMGKVQDTGGSIDEGQPQGHQRIYASCGQSGKNILNEILHIYLSLLL